MSLQRSAFLTQLLPAVTSSIFRGKTLPVCAQRLYPSRTPCSHGMSQTPVPIWKWCLFSNTHCPLAAVTGTNWASWVEGKFQPCTTLCTTFFNTQVLKQNCSPSLSWHQAGRRVVLPPPSLSCLGSGQSPQHWPSSSLH